MHAAMHTQNVFALIIANKGFVSNTCDTERDKPKTNTWKKNTEIPEIFLLTD